MYVGTSLTDVTIGLYLNRISAVDENKEVSKGNINVTSIHTPKSHTAHILFETIKKLIAQFQEISFDVFLQVIWEDKRIRHRSGVLPDTHPNVSDITGDHDTISLMADGDELAAASAITQEFIDLKVEERQKLWVPDLYIRQLREMKVLTLFEEISSLRLYRNSTVVFSLG